MYIFAVETNEKEMAKYFKNRDEVLNYLNSLPYGQVLEVAADAIMEAQNGVSRKITITREQFERYFRIQGINAETGEAETRGRKRKEDKESVELFQG